MGWSIGFDAKWDRDIGYGVPCTCDQPGCDKKIDRGLSYVCGADAYGGDKGCGLFFCDTHLYLGFGSDPQMCKRCCADAAPYEPKPDIAEWIDWKLTDDSWEQWRLDNPEEVKKLSGTIKSKPMKFI